MPEKEVLYSLGEIKGELKGIHEKIDAVLEQAQKTNGRVNRLEEWRSNLMGKITIIVVIVGAIFSTASGMLSKVLSTLIPAIK